MQWTARNMKVKVSDELRWAVYFGSLLPGSPIHASSQFILVKLELKSTKEGRRGVGGLKGFPMFQLK